ncbi:MAG TPA: FAD-binding oxidoreductase [Acidimicrobiia bacterium]
MTSENNGSPVLKRLETEVRGTLITPTSGEYDTARELMMVGRDPRPLALIRPADVGDMASAISVLADEGAPFVIRGGGHHPAAWAAGDGVYVLDTRAMKGIDVDVDARTVTVEAGVTTGECTDATSKFGLVTGFGDTPTVGVAGLTLGGGVGYLSRAHGLTVDNLLGADVVTADGQVIHADPDEHQDLFWAIRGGGRGYGAVARLRFALREVSDIYGGRLLFMATPEVLYQLVAAAMEAPEGLSTIVQVMTAPPVPFLPPEIHGRPIIALPGCFLGDEEAGRQAYAPLRGVAAPVIDAVATTPYRSLLEEPPGPPLPVRFASGFRDTWDLSTAETVLEMITEPAQGMRAVQLRPLGGAIADVAPEDTAFRHRNRRLLLWFMGGHMGRDDLPDAADWLDRARGRLAEGPDAFSSFMGDDQKVEEAFPGSTWDRLLAVKSAYDPRGVFG